ncbi:hypothetical protein KJ910_01745 [Patescibacteria group bacterium]|nr:hypothetical protein [Patescibacteria group bacterium]MBU1907420.1 hypothetical protein [Patescibacteria group bacterium]
MSKEITNNQLAERFDNLDATNNQLAEQIAKIDSRFDGLEVRFGGLEGRFDGLEVRFDGLDGRFGGLETTLNEFREDFEQFSIVTKQEFDRVNSKADRNWNEIMSVGDHVVRLEQEVKLENASHCSRINRLENHCGI